MILTLNKPRDEEKVGLAIKSKCTRAFKPRFIYFWPCQIPKLFQTVLALLPFHFDMASAQINSSVQRPMSHATVSPMQYYSEDIIAYAIRKALNTKLHSGSAPERNNQVLVVSPLLCNTTPQTCCNSTLKKHVALDRTSWSLKSVRNRFL